MRHLRTEMAAIVLGFLALPGALRADEITLFEPAVRGTGTKVLHFPPDHCVGNLYVPPESVPSWAPDRVCPENWEYIGTARGDVTVPGDRAVQLVVGLAPRLGDSARLLAQDRLAHQMLVTDRARVKPDDLSGLSELGPDDLCWLTVSALVPRADADQRVLEPVRRLTGVQMLSLHTTGVTDKGMENLRALRSLRALELSGERSIGNAGLAILKDLPALEYLDLDTGVTDAGLKQVAQAGSIRWLRIRTGGFWGPGLAELAQMPRLERLCLWGNVQITDRHITHLEGLTQIKSLTLWGSACDNLTDASLAPIGKLRNLEELYFIRTSPRFTSAGVAQLRNLKRLKTVDFAYAWASRSGELYGDEIARQLAMMPQLEGAKGLAYLSAEGVKSLATLRSLKCLGINLKSRRQGYYRPTGLSHLSELGSLEELAITSNDPLSDTDLGSLGSLTHLRKLDILSYGVTDAGLASLGKLKGLEHLALGGPVSRSGLNGLNGLSNLQSLQVGSWPGPGGTAQADELTLDLSGLKRMKDLNLSGLPLHDEDLAFLRNLPSLKNLMIQPRTSLSAQSLRYVSHLPELNRLFISGLSRCTGGDLAPLGDLATVKDLTLGGEIPDMALSALGGPPGLQSLTVRTSEPIRSQTVSDLKQRLPTIGYIHIEEPLPQPTPSTQRPRARQPHK